MRLSGRIALVTGAGGGLGGATAIRLAEEGALVICSDVRADAAETTARACGTASGSYVIVADVADSSSVDAMFERISSEHGRLDVLAATAGISSMQDLEAGSGVGRGADAGGGSPRAATSTVSAPYVPHVDMMSDETWRRMQAVHLDGTFYCIRRAVPLMRAAGKGSIVCMSSIAGTAGLGPFHYAAAKGAILGLVRSLARDLGPEGIRINAVAPGGIDAGMTKLHDPKIIEAFAPTVPLRRMGDAIDIANAILHLACDESAYTTGQILSPNGGVVIS